jgi:hypothetical protein
MSGKFGVFISMSMIQFYHTVFNAHFMLYLYFKNLIFQAKYFLEFFRIKYEEEFAWIMEAVKERQDKCPKMIINVTRVE